MSFNSIRKTLGLALGSCLLFSSAVVFGANSDATETQLKAAIDGDARSAENKSRDAYRHPFETLMFFGIKPDMTVVEISPGGGWYTEILGPFLNEKGQYIAAGYDRDSDNERVQAAIKRFEEKLDSNPGYSNAKVTELSPPEKVEIAPAGSADMVLTFRNTHGFMRGDTAEAHFAAFFKALKPGGILGLVQHRGTGEQPQDPKAPKGYVNEDYVIELAEKAGFKLVAKSEVNANPKDTKDYEDGVWTLPPVLRKGDVDKDKYTEIGESDRMTLKFMKPKS